MDWGFLVLIIWCKPFSTESNEIKIIAKVGNEIITSLELESKIKSILLLLTNLYGPKDNFSDKGSHVIPGLMQRIHKAKLENNDFVEVWGSGNPKREFLYVDDLASSVLFIIKNNISHNLLNIGSSEEISISELVTLLANLIEYKGQIKFNSNYPDGNQKKMIDSSKINKLGWKAETSLKEGLSKTYSWYVKNSKLLDVPK